MTSFSQQPVVINGKKQCEKCKTYYSKTARHSCPLEKTISCKICELTFNNIKLYNGHKCWHLERNEGKSPRERVAKINENPVTAHHHAKKMVTRAEGKNEAGRCSKCWKYFRFKAEFEHHSCKDKFKVFVPADANKGEFMEDMMKNCERCNSFFIDEESLQKHYPICELRRPFHCHKCNGAFFHRRVLKWHYEQFHEMQDDESAFEPTCRNKDSLLKSLKSKQVPTLCNLNKPIKLVVTHSFRTNNSSERDNSDKTSAETNKNAKIKRIVIQNNETTRFEKIVIKEEVQEDYDFVPYDKSIILKTEEGTTSIKKEYFSFFRTSHNEQYSTCTKCKRKFGNRWSLRQHYHLIHKSQKYRCASCQKVFHSNLALTTHERKVHKHFECKICTRVFPQEQFQHHLRIHKREFQTTRAKWNCCRKIFPRSWSYAWHLSRVHSGSHVHKCTICKRIFDTNNALEFHVGSTHIEYKEYGCRNCCKTFGNHLISRRHRLNHHRIFRCPACNLQFGKRKSLQIHLKSNLHFSNSNASAVGHLGHACYICSKSFGSPQLLQMHNKFVHQYSDLLQHFQTKGKQVEIPIRKSHNCNVCSKTFQSIHEMNVHVSEHEFKCQQCPKVYKTQTSLNHHVNFAHESEESATTTKKDQCPYCEKKIQSGRMLQDHLKVHKCPICHKHFKLPDSIRRHLRNIHLSKGKVSRELEQQYPILFEILNKSDNANIKIST